jgi:hypothetical protein
MTVTNNYLTKQELATQKVPGSKAVELTGFDDKLNPVYGARLLANEINADAKYLSNTFGSVFVKDNVDNNSTYIRHSGDASFLFDKQGEQVASWAWDTLDINIPEAIKPALEIIKSALAPLKKLLEIIKEALAILASLAINISEALRVLLEEVINVLINALEWFNIEVSLHALFVPPIVPTQVRADTDKLIDVSKYIVSGASNAIGMVSPALASRVSALSNTRTGGNVGFHKLVTSKLDDKLDTNRPQFKDNNYIAGSVVMLGYPIEELYNIYYKIRRVFSVAPLPKHSRTTQPITVSGIHYVRNLDLIVLDIVNTNKDKLITLSKPKVKYLRRKHFLVMYTNAAVTSEVTSYRDTITNFYSKGGNLEDVPVSILSASAPNIYILGTEIYDSDVFDILEFSVPDKLASSSSYKYSLYSIHEIIDSSSGNDVQRLVVVPGSSGVLNVPVYGKLQVNYGSGSAPQWVEVSSMFDLFEVLGVVRDFFGLVRKYINGFFSRVASQLKSILEELTKYLDFVAKILANIDKVLDLLKDLAGLGVGGSILMFQGEGGNSTLKKILTDSLIDRPAKLYNKAVDNTSRPSLENMSLEHSNWNAAKKNTKKYYAKLGEQFDSLDFSSDTYSYSGSFPPNFDPRESVAGFVLVAGGDSIDNVSKMYALLKSLLTPDREQQSTDAAFGEDILSPIGEPEYNLPDISLDTINKVNIAYPESSDNSGSVIPGAYTQALEATNNPDDMLEDFCRS